MKPLPIAHCRLPICYDNQQRKKASWHLLQGQLNEI